MSRARSTLQLVHYWWPLVVGWSIAVVVGRATLQTWNPTGLAVLLLGIGTAYSLDRIVDTTPDALTGWMRGALALAALGSASAACVLLRELPPPTAAVVPVVGVFVLLYPAIKRLPLTKTVFVPLIWTWCAIALPFNDGSWFGWHWILQPIAVPLFLLLASDCLLCDLKDETRDRQRGVASLPVVLGPRRATAIAVGLAMTAAVAAHLEQRPGLAYSALGLSATTLWPGLLATDVVGPLLVDVIVTLPGFLIAAHLV